MSDTIKSQVRYPRALHAALTKLAAANRRSINAEVVMAIEDRVAKAMQADTDFSRADLGTPIKRLRKEQSGRVEKSTPPTRDVIDLMSALKSSLGRQATKRTKGKR